MKHSLFCLQYDQGRAIYLAAFFFFFFFFFESSSSSGGASTTSGGGVGSFFSSSLTATKRPITSLVLMQYSSSISNSPKMSSISALVILSPQVMRACWNILESILPSKSCLESLNNEVVGVISISSHLLLEHLDHVVISAGTTN